MDKTELTIDELAFYCYNCDGKQFKKDMFGDEPIFVGYYMDDKFKDFQTRLQDFIFNLDKNHREKFAVGVKEFYKKNNGGK